MKLDLLGLDMFTYVNSKLLFYKNLNHFNFDKLNDLQCKIKFFQLLIQLE